jgi:hypothetical protein
MQPPPPQQQQQQQPQGKHTICATTSKNFVRDQNTPLTSVFEESIHILSDTECEAEDEKVDNEDVNSTDVDPKLNSNEVAHDTTKVRFASKTQKIKRIKVKDIENDTKKRWYSKAELAKIASDVNGLVEKIDKEGQLDFEDDMETKYNDTRRGLEKSTEVGARKLYDRRRYALHIVMTLQSQQRDDKEHKSSDAALLIAKAYMTSTKEACEEAIKFGKQDAREARKNRIRRRSTTSEPDLLSNERSR